MRCSKSLAVASVCQVILSGYFLFMAYSLVQDEVWGIDFSEDLFRVIVSIILGGIAVWCVTTAIGVWRLRRWGRTSSLWLSYAVFIGYIPIIAWYGYMVKTAPDVGWSWEILHPLVPFSAVGIWWLVLFTRPEVKEQFLRHSNPTAPIK